MGYEKHVESQESRGGWRAWLTLEPRIAYHHQTNPTIYKINIIASYIQLSVNTCLDPNVLVFPLFLGAFSPSSSIGFGTPKKTPTTTTKKQNEWFPPRPTVFDVENCFSLSLYGRNYQYGPNLPPFRPPSLLRAPSLFVIVALFLFSSNLTSEINMFIGKKIIV